MSTRRFLVQRRAHAEGHAADELRARRLRVEDAACREDAEHPPQPDLGRIRIDADLGEVGAVGVDRIRLVVRIFPHRERSSPSGFHALGGDRSPLLQLLAQRHGTRCRRRCTCWSRPTIRRSLRRADSRNVRARLERDRAACPSVSAATWATIVYVPVPMSVMSELDQRSAVRSMPHGRLARPTGTACGSRPPCRSRPASGRRCTLAGLRRPALPAEPARAFAHALDEPAIAERDCRVSGWTSGSFRMRSSIGSMSERIRQLVHRGLDREQSGRFARRADVFAARQIELDQPVSRQPVRRRVQRPRRSRRSVRVVRDRARCASYIVRERDQAAVARRRPAARAGS